MDYSKIKERMEKTINAFTEKLGEVRAGRANPAILNKIKIEYYGVPTPINQVAAVSVPEARLIVIQPWDASCLKDIERAILASDIGINPNNDGKVIRLNFPELTGERRKELEADIEGVMKVLEEGCKKANEKANATLNKNGEAFTTEERNMLIVELTKKLSPEERKKVAALLKLL